MAGDTSVHLEGRINAHRRLLVELVSILGTIPDARDALYTAQGWTRFDETLDPYGPAEIEQERLRYRR